ncbi:MAG: hypothetical protein JJT89_03595 [Nitriliruptoraceae bacterium]|nr:hypothetical protein [Nitriliruptoraceae bacterium]
MDDHGLHEGIDPASHRVHLAGSGAQAVVVVHGIGEQRPLSTLRSFAGAVRGASREAYAVPDTTDTTFELHTLVLPADDDHPRTDLYEGYWAPESTGTRLAHVTRWAKRLLLRSPRRLPTRIRGVALRVGLAVLVTLGALVWLGADVVAWVTGDAEAGLPSLAKALAAVLGAVVVRFLTDSLGDAARYLDVHPRNIAQRQAIRRRLVDLLDGLHRSGRYERIVVVGHSLGGVIAYDAVRLLWRERFQGVDVPADLEDTALMRAGAELEAAVEAARRRGLRGSDVGDDPTVDAAAAGFRAAQDRFAGALRAAMPGRWLVTDLITLGSPIAHAGWLLSDGGSDLAMRIVERELPTCPPQPASRTGSPGLSYGPDGARRLHHGAVFGPTRWLNGWFAGDPVGGPVLSTGDVASGRCERDAGLGCGVVDLRLGGPRGVLRGLAWHVRYWTDPDARQALLVALAITRAGLDERVVDLAPATPAEGADRAATGPR